MVFFSGFDWVFVVNWVIEWVNDVVEKIFVDWNFYDGVGLFDGVVFFDVMVGVEDNDVDVVGF